MIHKQLHTVPVHALDLYYRVNEKVLEREAFEMALELSKPYAVGFAELYTQLFEDLMFHAMSITFLGAHRGA